MKVVDTELLVIGGGVAGAYAALTARTFGADVVLACKTPLTGGSTRWAQGGIAAPAGPGDEAAHGEDTLRAGRGLCEPETVARFVAEARAHVETLRDLGVAFSPIHTLEGGHSCPRIRHTGDATGHAISEALARALEATQGAGLRLLEGAFASNLRLHAGQVVGADLITPQGPVHVRAGAVLLATGGFGQLFPVTTAPPEGTGDGLALAYRAGAALRDLEFVQFHPTAVVIGGKAHLVTEAARGEGGVLRNAHGERFMTRYDPQLELAPRDTVARAIAAEISRTGRVDLDLRHLGEAFVHARFPTVSQTLAGLGLNMGRDLIAVQPAVHYTMGGVQTDTYGRTTIPGLYAAGEVASSGLHGANRLASNSLSEGLVFGARAAREALAVGSLPLHDGEAVPAPGADTAGLPALRARVAGAAGLLRSGAGLRAVLDAQPLPASPTLSRAALEAANLELLAGLLIRAALSREESRGGHARQDFPCEAPQAVHTVQTYEGTVATLTAVPVRQSVLRFSA
ncbi:FAD-binding protein [Deinococcus deserti]|uniref:L-aspartate oxidase n=1 Tax=Deinococcus deserti (strain DSM 17065 / CIP 109153 / LMG 22923 / VCD115) TaxID=546414 RepID=C1CVS8_DEIDV|nr:FAD-binding protein [Deinococcus deserti]ACO46295.1 putative L-aspartate oxidase (Quinolinate synthetase B) [Deinococcus deserti VCD115]